jgi:hypothetical protein
MPDQDLTHAIFLPLCAQETIDLTRGKALKPVAQYPLAQTMNLVFITDGMGITVRFLTSYPKSPTPYSIPGLSLDHQTLIVLPYIPTASPQAPDNPHLNTVSPGSWVVITSTATGAYVGVYQLPTNAESLKQTLVISLTHANSRFVPANFDAPPADEFSADRLQRAQMSIVVAFGIEPLSVTMHTPPAWACLHEQYWQLGGVTCSLAPREVRKLSYVRTVGRLDSTTDQAQMQTSINLSVTGSASWGWGSVSAAMSAAFSSSQTSTHTTAITTQDVTAVEQTVLNLGKAPVSILEWQLIDRYVVLSQTKPPAVVEAAQPATVMRMFPPNASVTFAAPLGMSGPDNE